eukprot:7292972-Prymnesium_polylepis.1
MGARRRQAAGARRQARARAHILHHRLHARHLAGAVLRRLLDLHGRLRPLEGNLLLDLRKRSLVAGRDRHEPGRLALLEALLRRGVHGVAGLGGARRQRESKGARAHAEERAAAIRRAGRAAHARGTHGGDACACAALHRGGRATRPQRLARAPGPRRALSSRADASA